MRIQAAVYKSEQGARRRVNEDGVMVLRQVPLFAVADGKGGSEAAHTVLTALKNGSQVLRDKGRDLVTNPNTQSRLAVGTFFESALDRANIALQDATDRRTDGRKLVSTLVAATVVGPFGYVAHVGDSRAYLMRDGELRCLTNDHTIAALQLRRGDITHADFLTSPFRKHLAQALGMSVTLDVDVAEIRLLPKDRLLLCTNGLTGALDEEAIAEHLTGGDAEDAATRLIEAAKRMGAKDNVTLVLADVERDPASDVSQDDLAHYVRQAFLFKGLSEPEWLRVAPYLEHIQVAPNERICTEGEAAPGFYVVAKGQVLLHSANNERQEVGISGSFGALALADDTTQLRSATGLGASHLYLLTRRNFRQFMRHNPALGTRLTLSLLDRLGDRLGTLSTRLATIEQIVHGQR